LNRELFREDEAFLSFDLGSQGMSAMWTRPAGAEVVTVEVDFQEEFPELGLTEGGILPPASPGEALQPVWMYLAAFQSLLRKLRREAGDAGMRLVRRIAADGQQHGSTYWNSRAAGTLAGLDESKPLAAQLGSALAFPFARTWMTANTSAARTRMTEEAGGVADYVGVCGSQPFERYTGTVIADTVTRYPLVLPRTAGIRLVEQVPYMVATGRFDAPLGWGGACGTALWDYREKTWSGKLLRIALDETGNRPGPALEPLLPPIVSPGTSERVCAYFASVSGVSPDCRVYEPAGDNPAVRVTIRSRSTGGVVKPATVISLGTSVTVNIGLEEEKVDPGGRLALMFDYIGRPFFLACKTNGTARWDEVRKDHGISFEEQDEILRKYIERIVRSPGGPANPTFYFRYAQPETFPETRPFTARVGYEPERDVDLRAVIETTLADIAVYAGSLLPEGEPVYIVGGGSRSRPILEMFSAMLARTLVVSETSSEGACAGSNLAARFFYLNETRGEVTLEDLIGTASSGTPVNPRRPLVEYYRRRGGFLDRFKSVRGRLTGTAL